MATPQAPQLPDVATALASKNSKDVENANLGDNVYQALAQNYAEMAATVRPLNDSGDTILSILTRDLGALEAQNRTQSLAYEAGFRPDMGQDIQAILMRDMRDSALQISQVCQKHE